MHLVGLNEDREMCAIMEEYVDECVATRVDEEARKTAERMIKMGKMSLGEIAECIPTLTMEEIKKIKEKSCI